MHNSAIPPLQINVMAIDRQTHRVYPMLFISEKRLMRTQYRHYLGGGWRDFVRDRHLHEGDHVRFSWGRDPRVLYLRCGERSRRVPLSFGCVWKWATMPLLLQEDSIPIAHGHGSETESHTPALMTPHNNQVVILVPMRELALQTSQVCKELGKHLKIQLSLKDDIMRLHQPVHLLLGTPGRILDLEKKVVCVLKDCSMLIMDEAEKLLSPEFQLSIEQLIQFMPTTRQIMMFSATFHVTAKDFKDGYLRNPYAINIMDELTLKVFILVPTRELELQTSQVCKELGKHLKFK